jgi:hypothetical protein
MRTEFDVKLRVESSSYLREDSLKGSRRQLA